MNLLSPERIESAVRTIDPVFRDTPLVRHDAIDEVTGCSVFIKLEILNPIRSFKGRGAEFFVQNLGGRVGCLVAASAGNFGQGLAFAAAKRGLPLIIFAARTANPVKVVAMRRLGAEVRLDGADLDAAKVAAKSYAERNSLLFVEDGAHPAFAEGGATIAYELTHKESAPDAVVVPLGNGALVSGIGAWMRYAAPQTRVIGVVAKGARAMQLSFEQGRIVETSQVDTIADGIAVRVPVPFALRTMRHNVDEVLAVSDHDLIEALRVASRILGVVAEPAGVAGLAGIFTHKTQFRGQRVATVLCGANVSEGQFAEWVHGRPPGRVAG